MTVEEKVRRIIIELVRRIGYNFNKNDAPAEHSYINQATQDILELMKPMSRERIKIALENIKLPWKDFYPYEYIEQDNGVLIIKPKIVDIIIDAILAEWGKG